MPITLETIRTRSDEVNTLAKVFFARSQWRKSQCMKRGGFGDAIAEVWVRMLSDRRSGTPANCTLSTFVFNHCKWAMATWNRKRATKVIYSPRTIPVCEREGTDFEAMGLIASHLKKESIPRQWAAIALSFGLDGDVGPEVSLNVHPVRIRQIRLKGISRLQRTLERSISRDVLELLERVHLGPDDLARGTAGGDTTGGQS